MDISKLLNAEEVDEHAPTKAEDRSPLPTLRPPASPTTEQPYGNGDHEHGRVDFEAASILSDLRNSGHRGASTEAAHSHLQPFFYAPPSAVCAPESLRSRPPTSPLQSSNAPFPPYPEPSVSSSDQSYFAAAFGTGRTATPRKDKGLLSSPAQSSPLRESHTPHTPVCDRRTSSSPSSTGSTRLASSSPIATSSQRIKQEPNNTPPAFQPCELSGRELHGTSYGARSLLADTEERIGPVRRSRSTSSRQFLHTTLPHVKEEATDTSSGAEPDEATAKAIAEALNEYGTRRGGRRSFSPLATPRTPRTPASRNHTPRAIMSSPIPTSARSKELTPASSTPDPAAKVEPTSTPKPSENPKPAPPKAEKKGVARKPPPKKRKTDASSDAASIASANWKKTPKHRRKPIDTDAATVGSEAPPQDEPSEPESVEDENMLYCICRKPDNHTWMIGCDGGCEDWFHGKCVGMRQEDEDLLDRYICPNCVEAGIGVTTWKPMCRRAGCNNPARLKKGSESKYCSDSCAEDFWKEKLIVGTEGGSKKIKRGHVKEEESEQVPQPLGGTIPASALTSLIASSSSAQHFRRLGSPEALTPPQSRPGSSPGPKQSNLAEYETSRLADLDNRKSMLRQRRVALKEREEFVRLTRERAARAKERNGGKAICGYDARLAWDEITMAEWRASSAGKHAFENGTLSPPPETESAEGGDGKICERKTCGRHHTWAKLALQEVRFDEEQVREEMKGLIKEEEELKLSARGRGGGEVHGWVEVVG